MRAIACLAAWSGAMMLACACPTVTERPLVRVGGEEARFEDSGAAELAALRRRGQADLECPEVEIEQTLAFGDDVTRVTGCGKRGLYLRVEKRDDRTTYPTTDVDFLDLARAAPEDAGAWQAGRHPARELVALNERASADLRCPRDGVAPYAISPRARHVEESGAVHPFEHRWRAEGCGKVAQYDHDGDRLALASVDSLCEPYAKGCAGCACTESFLAWRLWEARVEAYRGEPRPGPLPGRVQLRVEIVYGTPYADVLQQRGDAWRVACEGSCRVALDPEGTYRVQIPTDYPFRSSAPFHLPRGRRSVTARVVSGYAGDGRSPEVSFPDEPE
jgi:hypothetical protein